MKNLHVGIEPSNYESRPLGLRASKIYLIAWHEGYFCFVVMSQTLLRVVSLMLGRYYKCIWSICWVLHHDLCMFGLNLLPAAVILIDWLRRILTMPQLLETEIIEHEVLLNSLTLYKIFEYESLQTFLKFYRRLFNLPESS